MLLILLTAIMCIGLLTGCGESANTTKYFATSHEIQSLCVFIVSWFVLSHVVEPLIEKEVQTGKVRDRVFAYLVCLTSSIMMFLSGLNFLMLISL